MSSLKMNAGLQGQMGTKRLLHVWQTGKCMTNMLSCDNQKQMYYYLNDNNTFASDYV